MKTMMKLSSVCLFTASMVFSSVQTANAQNEGFSANARLAVELVYRPGFEQFSAHASAFSKQVSTLCKESSSDTFTSTRNSFASFVYEFGLVEFYRTGPMLAENRQNRLFYWPDKRRVGERQLRNLLNTDNLAHLELAEFQQKSVALQGFPAAERLLFSKSSEHAFSGEGSSNSCAALQLIARNMDDMALGLSSAWQIDDGIAQQYMAPDASASQFRSRTEVLRSIVTQISVAIDNVMMRKIKPMLDNQDTPARYAPLWRSGATAAMLAGNVESIRALVIDTKLADATNLEDELVFEFKTLAGVLGKLQALPSMVDDSGALSEDAESLLNAAQAILGGIRSTVNERFMSKLDVRAGFNSDDGD